MAEGGDDFSGHFAGLAPVQQDSAPSEFKGYFAGMSPGPEQAEASAGAGLGRKLKVAGNAVAGAVQNIVGLPGTVNQAGIDLLGKYAPGAANALSAVREQIMPTGEELSSGTGLGESNKELQPKDKTERFVAAGASALPDAALVALTGGGALPALAMTEGGSMAAQAITEAMPGSKIAPIVAGIVGSMGVGGVSGWLQKSKAAKLAVEALANKEELLKSAKSAFGEVVNDAAEARDVGMAKLAELKSASADRLGSVKSFVNNMIDHVEATAKGTTDWVAGKLGSSSTPEQVGRVGQEESRAWVDKVLPQKEAVLIKPVNDVMGTESLGIGGLKSVIDNVPKAKLSALKNNLPPDLLETFTDAIELSKPIPWNDARRLRTEIGTMLKDNKISADIGDKRLEAMYSAATGDLRTAAKAKGVGEAFDSYNAEMTKLYNFRDNVVNKFITSTNPNAEAVLPGKAAEGFLTRAGRDGTEVAGLRAEMPKAADELAAYAARSGSWGKLSPEAKAGLVPDEAQRAALDTAASSRAQATTNGKQIIGQAQTEHDALLQEANSTRLKELLANRASARAAKQSVGKAEAGVEDAKAAVPAKPNPVTNLVHQVRGAVGGAIGNELMGAFAPALPPGARTALLAAGYLVPAAYRAGKNFVSNPRNLLAPAVGAAEGAQVNKLNNNQ